MATYKSDGLRISTYVNGISGRGISNIQNYYYASASDDASKLPALPDTEGTDWKDDISSLDAPFNGVNKYLWNYEKISYTKIETDTTDPEPLRTTPTILGVWGKSFDNVYEYYAITGTDSAPDVPLENEDGTWPDTYTTSAGDVWIKDIAGSTLPKPTKDKPYLWNYEILNFNDGNDQYFGPTCIGTYGNSISETKEYYCATASRTPIPGRYSDSDAKTIDEDTWTTSLSSAGQSATKPFLWNFERTSFSMDDPQDTEVSLISSEPRAIESITEYYQISTSRLTDGATQIDSDHNLPPEIADGWDDVKPDLDQGETLWNFEVIKYSATDENGQNLYSWTEPTSIGYMGLDGTSFSGVERRYKATTSGGKPTSTPNDTLFNSWKDTPAAAGFSQTNKYLWFFEKISTSKGHSYTPIELSAIWSKDGDEGRQYEESKYFYLVNNSAGSCGTVDVETDETGEPFEKEGGIWKSNHNALSKGQALWVAEYQKFSRPATGKTKVWETLPVRLLSYVGADGLSESGVSLTVSSYVAKSTDASPIRVESSLYGDAATATDIDWIWHAKVGSSNPTMIEATEDDENKGNIYKSSDGDDLYVEADAFDNTDTIQIRIAGEKDGDVLYQDYTTLKLLVDGDDAYVAFLTNPHASISADKDGNATTSTQISTEVVVMKGGTPQKVIVDEDIQSSLFDVDVSNTNGNATVTAKVINATSTNKPNLGSTSSCSGTIDINITSPITQTLSFNWTKTNTGATGASALTLSLSNDNEVVVKNNAGIYVSTFPIFCTAQLYDGNTEITNASYKWTRPGQEDIISGSQTLTLKVDSYDDSGNLVTGNYEPGNYVVTATYGGVPYTKTFTVAETTAQVDYSLIVPTTVNTSNTDWSFSIQVLKTGKGYEGDVDGTGTLATAGSHPIKIQRKDKNDEGEVVYINLDSWKDIWISQDTTFRLVSTSDEALVWDEETVEVIQDNSIKYKYYLSNSGTAPSYSETNSWKDAPSGVSATNQYEYITQIQKALPIVAKTIEEELNSLPKKEWEKRGAIGYEWNPSTEEDTNIEIGDIVCVKGKTTDEGEQNAIIYGNVVGKRTIENEDGTTFIVFDIISAALVIGEQPNNLVLTIVSKPKLWAKWGEVGADGATKGTITLYQAYTEQDPETQEYLIPETPKNGVISNSGWETTSPSQWSGKFVWKTYGTFTETKKSDGTKTTTYGTQWTTPELHDAKYGEITGEKAVAFYKLFGYDADKEGIAYDDYGHAYINATMITTGALTVGNTDNPIFSADWGGDQKVDENGNPMTDNNGQPIMKEPACTIGGWYVDKNVISDGNSDDKFGTVGIYSGGTDEKFTMSSLIPDGGIQPIRFYAGLNNAASTVNFAVLKDGSTYLTAAQIGNDVTIRGSDTQAAMKVGDLVTQYNTTQKKADDYSKEVKDLKDSYIDAYSSEWYSINKTKPEDEI